MCVTVSADTHFRVLQNRSIGPTYGEKNFTVTRNYLNITNEQLYRIRSPDLVKKKICFNKAQRPVHWTAHSTLRFSLLHPWHTCSFRHLYFSGKYSSNAAIIREDYSLTFTTPSKARYSLIQLTERKHHGENENAQTLKWYQRGIRTRALLIASPPFYG